MFIYESCYGTVHYSGGGKGQIMDPLWNTNKCHQRLKEQGQTFRLFLWTIAAFSLLFSPVLVLDHFHWNVLFVC